MMSRRAWVTWGIAAALILSGIFFISNLSRPETTQMTKEINTASASENEIPNKTDTGKNVGIAIDSSKEISTFLSTTMLYLESARGRCLQVADLIPDVSTGAFPVSSFVNQIHKAETDIQEMRKLMARDSVALKGKLGGNYPGEIEEISSLADQSLKGYANGLTKMREDAAWPSKEALDKAFKAFEEATGLYSKAGKLAESYNSGKESSTKTLSSSLANISGEINKPLSTSTTKENVQSQIRPIISAVSNEHEKEAEAFVKYLKENYPDIGIKYSDLPIDITFNNLAQIKYFTTNDYQEGIILIYPISKTLTSKEIKESPSIPVYLYKMAANTYHGVTKFRIGYYNIKNQFDTSRNINYIAILLDNGQDQMGYLLDMSIPAGSIVANDAIIYTAYLGGSTNTLVDVRSNALFNKFLTGEKL